MNESSFSVILLPTLNCNAKCDYCFEDSTSGSMTHKTFSAILEKLFEYMDECHIGGLNLYWQGGEVFTLSPDWFYQANEIMKSIADRQDRTLANYLQSNLLVYNESWKPVIRNIFGGSIGTSMDFPNLHRRTSGNTTNEYTELWLNNVREALNDGFNVGVIAVPSSETLMRGAQDFYDFFVRDARVNEFQVNPPFPGGATNTTKQGLPLDAIKLGNFLIELSDIWLSQGLNKGIKVGPSSEILDYFFYGDTVIPCFWQDNCANNFICIDPAGNVSQCDCWITSYPEMHFGNILQTSSLSSLLKSNPARLKFLNRPGNLVKEHDCLECEHLAFCHGGCPVRAFSTFDTLLAKDPYCDTYKLLFSHLKKVIRHHKF